MKNQTIILPIISLAISVIALAWVWFNYSQISTVQSLPAIQNDIAALAPFNVTFVSDEENFWEKVEAVKANVFKAMDYEIVTSDSAKWKALIEKFDAKYLPLMVTWEAIKTSEIKDYLDQLAVEKDWEFSVSISDIASQMQVDISKSFLQLPKALDFDPVKWPEDAKVTFIEVSDFECPYCSKFHNEAYKQVEEKYWDQIKFVFKNLPLSFHPEAQKAAEAWLCANKQWKFWEMHDVMFENQEELWVENYKKWAWEFWMDVETFSACLDNWETADQVKAHSDQAWAFWIQWTPWVFVNDKFVNWAYPFETFEKLIEAELAK